MDEQQQNEVETWLGQYTASIATLTAGAAASVWAPFAQLGDWFDPNETLDATRDASRAILAAIEAVDALVSQWTSLVISIVTGTTSSSIATPTIATTPPVAYPRAGVDPFQVYSRPVWRYRDTLGEGGTQEQAIAAAQLQVDVTSHMDAMLAAREAAMAQALEEARAGIAAERSLHFRRVIRPELSAGGACGLCIVASDQIYSFEDLMPLHDRCKCVVMPIVGDEDPGIRINTDDLGRFYTDAGTTASAGLKRTRYRVEEHSELGPLLVNADHVRHSFDYSPAAEAERARARLSKMLPVLRDLEKRVAAGENVSTWLTYQRTRIRELELLTEAA